MTSERIKNGQIVWPWPMTAGVLESGRMLPLSRKLHLFESELVFVRRTRSYLVKLVIQKKRLCQSSGVGIKRRKFCRFLCVHLP